MFEIVSDFESKIADFFGSPYAVATDCCTHAIELCLRYKNANNLTIPTHTYLSIPMTAIKLNLNWSWNDSWWEEYYHIGDNIFDAATMWRKNSYIPGSFMCVSFQYRKHLSLGRGGMILLDDINAKHTLTKLSYDGRTRDTKWPDQKIETIGYHYYMTPETAQLGLDKFDYAAINIPKIWNANDYPDLRIMPVFKDRQ